MSVVDWTSTIDIFAWSGIGVVAIAFACCLFACCIATGDQRLSVRSRIFRILIFFLLILVAIEVAHFAHDDWAAMHRPDPGNALFAPEPHTGVTTWCHSSTDTSPRAASVNPQTGVLTCPE